ncbi:hypothetical protein KCP69_17120 [Salmonella enterica subsp. enterica]|nr:hypothetical protein KCP69_17120 [Salmonella enterica subsp. enterica]
MTYETQKRFVIRNVLMGLGLVDGCRRVTLFKTNPPQFNFAAICAWRNTEHFVGAVLAGGGS